VARGAVGGLAGGEGGGAGGEGGGRRTAEQSKVVEMNVLPLYLVNGNGGGGGGTDTGPTAQQPVFVRQLGLDWMGEGIHANDPRSDSSGVVVWGAAIVCARWVADEAVKFGGKRVCELGAGCALPSLAAALYTEAAHVEATDSFRHAGTT
jgi:hypothetical protein